MPRPKRAPADPDTDPAASEDVVLAVRRFNRFYTRRIGALSRSYLGSPFSLAESRVLYEVAHHDAPTATLLARELGLDGGYLSRILRGFERQGLLRRTPSASDRRVSHLALTGAGRRALRALDASATRSVSDMLSGVSGPDRLRLTALLRTAESILRGRATGGDDVVIRSHRAGDFGWIVERHGEFYAATRGWDERFESLVAQVVARFAARHDPARERCWIAECGGERAGSVMLVRRGAATAQLRLLLVEPWARRRGIGRELVARCIEFARSAGYRRVVLWTDAGLVAAARIYADAGFRRMSAETVSRFGGAMRSEVWELSFSSRGSRGRARRGPPRRSRRSPGRGAPSPRAS